MPEIFGLEPPLFMGRFNTGNSFTLVYSKMNVLLQSLSRGHLSPQFNGAYKRRVISFIVRFRL